MNFVIIDTAHSELNIGIYSHGKTAINEKIEQPGRIQSKMIFETSQNMIEKSALTKVDFVAVNTGPGSYTGLRIGISFAKGLAYGYDAGVIGCSEFKFLERLAKKRRDNKKKLLLASVKKNTLNFELLNQNMEKESDGLLRSLQELKSFNKKHHFPTIYSRIDGLENYKNNTTEIKREDFMNAFFEQAKETIEGEGQKLDVFSDLDAKYVRSLDYY